MVALPCLRFANHHPTTSDYLRTNMNPTLRFILSVGAITVASFSNAASTPCPQHYYKGQAPEFTNSKLKQGSQELCNQAFGVMHSSLSKTPLWSAEHLTADSVASARGMERHNEFHPEDRLSIGERAELNDYKRSGYDRGHMAPSGDMPDSQSQYESFSLANMIPQAPRLNQGLWSDIEEGLRRYVSSMGDVYVLTGPVFKGSQISRLNDRVMVPTHVFKLVWNPRQQAGVAYLAENTDTTQYSLLSINELEQFTGLNLLPALGASAKRAILSMPQPKKRSRKTPAYEILDWNPAGPR